MFIKKCPGCENKVKKDFDFCPFCGNNLKSEHDKEDYGFLGKNDFVKESGSFIEKMLNSAMKLLEMQTRNLQNESSKSSKKTFQEPIHNSLSIQFFVNGKKISKEKKPNQFKPVRINNQFFQEKLRKLKDLPKQEPQSKLRRFSEKLIYELYVPGVKSVEDILINHLENSIEVKALSQDKVYSKNLKINLPILSYSLKDGFLIIELASGN